MAEFFATSRVLVVAGKGGVGKTTLGATIGMAAAQSGIDTLLVELEGHSNLGRLFGGAQLEYESRELIESNASGGRLRGRRITPDDALVDYLGSHGLDRVAGRLVENGAIDVVSTAAPGIRDLLALGKIRHLEESAEAQLIVVDAPAAGHAISFLRSPAGLHDSTASGPVGEQSEAVLAMLADPTRCQVMLVSLPEETPVTETIETAFSLEEDVGVKLAPIVVNGLWPEVPGLADALDQQGSTRSLIGRARRDAARFRLARIENQSAACERLADELPLPQVHLPQLFVPRLGLEHLQNLADTLSSELDRIGRNQVEP